MVPPNFQMINWYSVAANFLWIFALALALAFLSYAYWEARAHKAKLSISLRQPHYQMVFNISGILFCLGLAATSDATWEIALWLILTITFIVQLLRGVRST